MDMGVHLLYLAVPFPRGEACWREIGRKRSWVGIVTVSDQIRVENGLRGSIIKARRDKESEYSDKLTATKEI